MTTVVNKYKVNMSDPDIVYIGRGSVWGNDSEMKDRSDSERERVIQNYRKQLRDQLKGGTITKEMLLDLDGKRLVCYCAPKACHGDVLVKAIEWAKESNMNMVDTLKLKASQPTPEADEIAKLLIAATKGDVK